MTRRIDRDFPHQVKIAIPAGGLRFRYSAMHEFCLVRGFYVRTQNIRRADHDAIRWCLLDPPHADAFHAQFDGEKMTTRTTPG